MDALCDVYKPNNMSSTVLNKYLFGAQTTDDQFFSSNLNLDRCKNCCWLKSTHMTQKHAATTTFEKINEKATCVL